MSTDPHGLMAAAFGHPESYSERKRLISIISDARSALAEPYDNSRAGLAARTGRLEALLQMLADSAEIVASERP